MKPIDYLIVGAGPAGLQMGYYLKQLKQHYLILESGNHAGTFFEKFPRHRTLISINKPNTGYDDPEINLRWDWNSLLSDNEDLLFTKYSNNYFADANILCQYLKDYATTLQLNVEYNSQVKSVDKKDHFIVTDQNNNKYEAKKLIIAIGVMKGYMPPIPGIELTENYTDVSIEPNDFKNKRVLIIGKGNSGFETADNLIETTSIIHIISPKPLTHAWKSHYVGHLRAINNNFLDTYQLKNQNAVLDGTINWIKFEDNQYEVNVRYSHAHDEEETLYYDRVINCSGFEVDFDIFTDHCNPNKMINERFPVLTPEWESINIKDLFFIGVIMQVRDFKKFNSGFIHGFRYNIRTLSKIFENKYDGKPLEDKLLNLSIKEILNFTLNRINSSSGLWLLNGFLCDVIFFSDEKAHYIEEFPIDYVKDPVYFNHNEFITINFEFGKIDGDPFNIERNPSPEFASQSKFLHPVMRYYKNHELIIEEHLLEDLFGEWKKDIHIEPLACFFENVLTKHLDHLQVLA